MSKIFKISGSFMQDGKWSTPDPSFTGKIVVDDNDEFYGYCDELYESVEDEINRTRYLVGAFATNAKKGSRGIAFYKLSNYAAQAPLMYVVPDLLDGSGTWAAFVYMFFTSQMVIQGKSKLSVVEIPYTEEEEKQIKEKYDELDSVGGFV